MAAAVGLGQRDVVVGRQRLLDDHPAAGRDRRRRGVHEQQHPHRRDDGSQPAPIWPDAEVSATECAAMNVVVCVKQIPDPADPGALDPQTKTLKRDGKLILDESDSYGVEMALQLVDTAGGGEVTLVSMAPNSETSAACAPRWPWARPRPSSSATRPWPAPTPWPPPRSWPRPSSGSRAPTWSSPPPSRPTATPARCPSRSPSCSACPSVTFAKYDRGRRRRPSRSSARPRPATTRSSARCPRSCRSPPAWSSPATPRFKGIMAAKSKPVDEVTVADLGLDAGQVGWAGAGQEITSIAAAEAREAGEIVEDDGDGRREDRRLPREPQGHLGAMRHDAFQDLGLRRGRPTARCRRPPSSCSPRPASSADTVEAVYVGGDADAVAGDARRPRRHQGARHRRPRRRAARARPSPRPSPPRSSGGDAPDAILFAHHLRRPRRRRPPVGQARPHRAHQHRRPRRRRRRAGRHRAGLRWQHERHDHVHRRAARTSC